MSWAHVRRFEKPTYFVFLQDIADLLPLDMLLFGWVSAFPEEFAENCSIIITFAGGYISVTLGCDRHEVDESGYGHGADPRCLDERYV